MSIVKRKLEVGMHVSQLRARSNRHSFAKRIVLGLKKPAGTTLSPARWVSITRQIQAQLEESLRTQVEVFDYTNEVAVPEARTLPVADLKPDEVIRRKLVKMSQSNPSIERRTTEGFTALRPMDDAMDACFQSGNL